MGFVVIAMVLGAGVANATHYAYTPINYPGATGTYAYGINNSGQIVGAYSDASGNAHGFLKVGTAYTPIDYPRAFSKFPYGINDSGQIVGTYYGGGGHGFIATPINLPLIYQLLLLD